MAPDTGPNESANQSDEYLNNAPPYNFPGDSSDDDLDEDGDYIGGVNDDSDSGGGDNMAGYQLLNQEGGDEIVDNHRDDRQNGGGGSNYMCSDSEDVADSLNHLRQQQQQHPIQNIHLINPDLSSRFDRIELPPPPVDGISEQLESIPRPDIELDDDKIDQIKQAMSGFSLPSSSIPGWASVITEDQLAKFIHHKTNSN